MTEKFYVLSKMVNDNGATPCQEVKGFPGDVKQQNVFDLGDTMDVEFFTEDDIREMMMKGNAVLTPADDYDLLWEVAVFMSDVAGMYNYPFQLGFNLVCVVLNATHVTVTCGENTLIASKVNLQKAVA